jgi:DNA-binding Lrp family transcriptional regulator
MYPGIYTRALDEIKKLNYLEKISVVTGDYDIVVKVNVKNLEQLHKLTNQLQKVNGVEKTNTQVIEKELKSLSSQQSCFQIPSAVFVFIKNLQNIINK